MNQIKNRNIIITGLQSWDIEIGSNCKNIALEFSKHNRVLYVNTPKDRKTAFKRNWNNNRKTGFKKINDNLWVYYPDCVLESISRLPVNFIFDFLNKRNSIRFAKEIKKAIEYLDFSDFILFCDSDMFRSFYLKELLQPSLYIYYTRDNLMAVKYWQTQGIRIEPLHMAKADIVMANSTYLASLASTYNPKSYFIGQGCDLSAFKTYDNMIIPDDIKAIPCPRIGYIGVLKTLRLDINVIRNMADQKPDWNIILIGAEDDDFQNSDLHQKKNVWFLGKKDMGVLPFYLNAFDVAINPQVLNGVTIGNYPRKIDEYLAMGKPTVATRTEAMKFFSQYVSLASDNEEWIEALEKELRNNNDDLRKKRIAFATEHTWENNVAEIYSLINKNERK